MRTPHRLNSLRRRAMVWALVGALVVGCGPSLTVENKTEFAIHVTVRTSKGVDVVSPSPGESSSVDFEGGNFSAVAFLDQEWVNYMTSSRDTLNNLIAGVASGQRRIDRDELEAVLTTLRTLNSRIATIQGITGEAPSCSGSFNSSNESGGAVIEITYGVDNRLYAFCS
jgi:hypothetical protein